MKQLHPRNSPGIVQEKMSSEHQEYEDNTQRCHYHGRRSSPEAHEQRRQAKKDTGGNSWVLGYVGSNYLQRILTLVIEMLFFKVKIL